jgi:fatty acid desaturase
LINIRKEAVTKLDYQKIRQELLFKIPRGLVLGHMAANFCLIAAAVTLELFTPPWIKIPLQAAILSIVYFRAFGLMHEAVHSLGASGPRANLWVGRVSGWLCFLPFEAWKEIHLQHHYWAGNYEKDPTMKIVEKLRAGEFPITRLLNFAWRWGVPVMAFNQHLVFWAKSWSICRGWARARLVAGAALWMAIASAFLFSGHGMVLALSLFIYLVMVETINFPHHLDLPQLSGDSRLTVFDQHLISRSCVYPRWLARHVLLNFNYHVEHHLFPTLPYQQLEKAHELVQTIADRVEIHVCQGNEWIRSNRRKDFKEVFIGRDFEVPQPERKAA